MKEPKLECSDPLVHRNLVFAYSTVPITAQQNQAWINDLPTSLSVHADELGGGPPNIHKSMPANAIVKKLAAIQKSYTSPDAPTASLCLTTKEREWASSTNWKEIVSDA